VLLAVDIGNTNITFGIFKGKNLCRRFDVPSQNYSRTKLKRLLSRAVVDKSVICSVVPRLTGPVSQGLASLTGAKPYIIGKDIVVPVKNLYRKPKQVGQDRLINAYAALSLFNAPVIVVDCGTAVTFDVISSKREYLGGMILPGLNISLTALHERTALLPKVKLSKPREFIGRDTESSILSGLVYGMAALFDDLNRRIKQEVGSNALVVGTGGNIRLISGYCKSIAKIDPDLTLKGLALIAKNL
jgi:type III pantothenate kinase